MKCIKCKETYDDDFKFCPYCGEEKHAPKICPNCELEPKIEFSFCPECGTELIEKEESMRMRQEKYNKRIRSNLIKYVNDTIDHPILKEYLINQIKGGIINSIFDLDYELDLVKDNPKFILKTIVEKTELDSNLKSLLIYRINENKIRTENELEKEIEKEERKNKLRQHVENAVGLDYSSISNLKTRIKNGFIFDEEGLKKEIEIEKGNTKSREKEEERKNKLRQHVENAELDQYSKSDLIKKINQKYIINENELKRKIQIEEKATGLRKIVENSQIGIILKRELKEKINQKYIIDENELKRKIQIEEKAIELRKIVENAELDYYSKRDLIKRINRGFILNEEKLEREIRRKRKAEQTEQRAKRDESISSGSYSNKVDEGYGRRYWHDLYG